MVNVGLTDRAWLWVRDNALGRGTLFPVRPNIHRSGPESGPVQIPPDRSRGLPGGLQSAPPGTRRRKPRKTLALP